MNARLTIDELHICLDALKFSNKEGVLNTDYDYLIEKLEDIIEERIKFTEGGL